MFVCKGGSRTALTFKPVCTGEVSSPYRHSGESGRALAHDMRNPGTYTRVNRLDSGFRRNDILSYGQPLRLPLYVGRGKPCPYECIRLLCVCRRTIKSTEAAVLKPYLFLVGKKILIDKKD
jgi:hypothetical protein